MDEERFENEMRIAMDVGVEEEDNLEERVKFLLF